MLVAIHQPNYLPWLGYFAKIAAADVFIFLDDVQFSKGSYTNRVQIARDGKSVWLTLPIRCDFGDEISAVKIARDDWARSHGDMLKQAYRKADHFRQVWPDIERFLGQAEGNLADINAGLIGKFVEKLGLNVRFESSSEMDAKSTKPDERLVELVSMVDPQGIYLSGKGGAKYQTEDTFSDRGIELQYLGFSSPEYARSGDLFIPGLSIVDAVFHLGWEGTSELLKSR